MSLPGLTAALAAAALALTLGVAAPAHAGAGGDDPLLPPTRDARVALERADAILAGSADPTSYRLDASLALRDVFDKPELHQLAQQVLDAQLAQFDPAQLAELAELARASAGE